MPATQMPRELPLGSPKDVRWKTSGRFPGPRFVMVILREERRDMSNHLRNVLVMPGDWYWQRDWS